MTFRVKFSEQGGSFRAKFGALQTASDGGFDRGYAEGYEAGAKSVPDYFSMRLNGTLTEYSSESVTAIPNYGFYGMAKLEKLNLPNATSIGGNGLMNCTALRSVNLPKVTSLANYALQGCRSIAALDLPSLSVIQGAVFTNMTALVALVLRNNMVCSLGNQNSFNGTQIFSGTGYIYVPSALVANYKVARNWSTYAEQIRAIEDYPEITGG